MMTGDGVRKTLIETIALTNKPLARALSGLLPTDQCEAIQRTFEEACNDESDDEAVVAFGWCQRAAEEARATRFFPPGLAHPSAAFIEFAEHIERMPKLRALLADAVASWMRGDYPDGTVILAYDYLMRMRSVGHESAKSVREALRKAVDGEYSADRLITLIARNPPEDIKKVLAAAWGRNSGCQMIAFGAKIAGMLEGSLPSAYEAVRSFIANNVLPYDAVIQQLLDDVRLELIEGEEVQATYLTTGHSQSYWCQIRMRSSHARVTAIKTCVQEWSNRHHRPYGTLEVVYIDENDRKESSNFI